MAEESGPEPIDRKHPFAKELRKIRALKKRLGDPAVLMKMLGVIVAKQAQRSFEDQALGSDSWSPRYRGTEAGKEPSINIAGSLQDFASGRKAPKARRFQTSPALMDSGILRRSVSPGNSVKLLSTHSVEVGVTGVAQYYAPHQQFGIPSSQEVTEDALQNYTEWRRTLRQKRQKIGSYDAKSRKWKVKKGGGGGTPREPKTKYSEFLKYVRKLIREAKKAKRSVKKMRKFLKELFKDQSSRGKKMSVQGILRRRVKVEKKKRATKEERLKLLTAMVKRAEKMGFLYQTKVLKTNVVARPFLGITATVVIEIVRTIHDRLGIDGNSKS